VGADFPRWHGGQPFIIYVLRPLKRLAIALASPQSCNEQRREERTHAQIVSRKRGDILAAIKLPQKFQAARIFVSTLCLVSEPSDVHRCQRQRMLEHDPEK
jgi:hypothetical protein